MPTPQWPAADYAEKGMDQAAPIGIPLFSAPIPLTTAKYVFTQEWMAPADWPAEPIGKAHPSSGLVPDYSSYFLVSEGPRTDLGGGQVKWTRTYAQVPASYMLPETFTYSFIGTLTSIAGTNVTRTRQNWAVESMVFYDYFLAPSTGTDPLTGNSFDISGPGDIESLREFFYVFQNTIPPVTGAVLGGITLAVDILGPAGSSVPTYPSSDDYANKMVSDALQNNWGATKTKQVIFPTNNLQGSLQGSPPTGGHMAGTIDAANSVLGGLIVSEPSRLDVWMGSIFVRRTRYVRAQ